MLHPRCLWQESENVSVIYYKLQMFILDVSKSSEYNSSFLLFQKLTVPKKSQKISLGTLS